MPLIFRVLSFCRNVVHRRRIERDLESEVRGAFDLLVDEKIRAGMRPHEARRAAALEFGRLQTVEDQVRDARTGAVVEVLFRDLRHGARLLRRNPLFALTAALSLAIGIGATTTIFTLANALLLRDPIGIAEPKRLVDIGRTSDGFGFNPTSYPNYLDIRRRATTLQDVYAYPLFPQAMSLDGGASAAPAERVYGTLVTTNFFSVLGAVPAVGRLFDVGDGEQPGASPLVALSHSFWTRRFNKDPNIVGRTLRLNRHAFTVVGVAAEGFQGTGIRSGDLWVPMNMVSAATSQGEGVLTNRSAGWLLIGGRVKSGVTISEAAAEIDAIGQTLASEYAETNRHAGLRLVPLSSVPGNTKAIATFLLLLMVLAAVVLAIACTNIAGVLLARAAVRRWEMAVRIAIGAGRGRLIRQLLAETMVLFAVGAALGLVMVHGMTSLLMSVIPTLPFPLEVALGVESRAILFTTGVALVAALLAPAMQGSNVDVNASLKDDSGLPRRLRLRHVFVVAQVAFSILLVVIAGLFARALHRAGTTDPGFDSRGVELASLDLRVAGYNDTTGPLFARELIESVRRLPSVESATIAAVLPGGFEGIGLGSVHSLGAPVDGHDSVLPDWNVIEPGYFTTMRIPLVAGRDFALTDRQGGQPVAIVGEGTARRFWPGANPVGQALVLQRSGGELILQVVGVARDPRYGSLIDDSSGTYVYVPLQQEYVAGATMIVARSRTGQRITEDIRAVVASLNPSLPVMATQTAADYTSLGLAPQWLGAYVAGSLGLVGLLLAAIGIYGVTGYMVAQRTRELGIRVALGARPAVIVAMVLRQGMSLVTVGLVLGVLTAAAFSRLLASLLFGLPPYDPIAFGGAVVLFTVVGLAACYLPVRRASRIDAMQALRHE